MINLKKICNFFIIFIPILIISGCMSLEPARPYFQFTKDNPQVGLLAFSVTCSGIRRRINAHIINLKTKWNNDFEFMCDWENEPRKIMVLSIPAGGYTFASVEYSNPNEIIYTKEKDHFYFNIQPHKVNYIGRIEYFFSRDQVLTTIKNEDVDDFPEIKASIPLVPDKDYIVLYWEKNWLGDLIAK